MSKHTAESTPALGFLTVLEHAEHGLFGGYLLLNSSGRPLEFHCTAPIKPNRAQEILYGPTLTPYLYGEQIGQTLVEKSKLVPLFVCTDQEPALAAGQHISVPVALVLPPQQSSRTLRLDAAHTAGPGENHQHGGTELVTFELGSNHLAVPRQSDADRQLIADRAGSLYDSFDLSEPFERIRQAIEEAQQAVR